MGTQAPLRVAVVGGGIGGMSVAVALHQQGIHVDVFEQASQLGEIGAGVLITPNSLRLLERLDLGPALAKVGARIGEGSQYYRMDGTPVAPILTTDSSGWNGMYGMHRADLLDILASNLPEKNIHTGHRCTGMKQDDQSAVLYFENGTVFETDIVIAADGIHSLLRTYVSEPTEPVHSGSVAYRGLIPASQIPSWPKGISQLWMGEGKHFLVYPVRSGQLINYVGFVPSDEHTNESWSATGDPDQLRQEFSGWDPSIMMLLSEVTETYWWGLYDREPLEKWSQGRLTLLGDAGHPMLPHLGQGANQAIEDGYTLATLLSTASSLEAPRVLQVYEELRRPRTTQVQLGARDNGKRYDSDYKDLSVRDSEIANSVHFRSWLYDYDAEDIANKALIKNL